MPRANSRNAPSEVTGGPARGPHGVGLCPRKFPSATRAGPLPFYRTAQAWSKANALSNAARSRRFEAATGPISCTASPVS